jgi:SAM-dependent methyltransferase
MDWQAAPFARRFQHRIYTWYHDVKFGVSTGGLIEAADLGAKNQDATGYSALEYEYLLWALPAIPFPAEEVVFVDYGAGKGRALAAAATHPFRRVIGVEISGELVQVARRNLAGMKRRRAQCVEIHHADAALFEVPDDANVFFFFNPFAGETLARVVQRIEQSWMAHPRELFFIYFNHGRFDECIATRPWLRKIHETSFCGFYRLANAR